MTKTVLVIGATGAQGGSVARELLRRGFDVRALTRTPAAEEAAQLRALGADVERGDLFDGDSLVAAMRDVHGVFGMTSYWEHFERERELGANLVAAAAEVDVPHLVLSTAPHVGALTDGELVVPHYDMKAETAARALALNIPTTLVRPAFHYDNFVTFFAPRPQHDGTYVFGFPQGDAPLAGFAVEDMGAVVAQIFERGDELVGECLDLVGDVLTPHDYATIMSRVTDTDIRYAHVPRETFAAYGFRGAAHLADEFHFQRTHAQDRMHDRLRTRELHPGVQSFESWAVKHLRRLEQALAA